MRDSHLLSGVLPVNKPTGMTSHDVVAKLRRLLGTKKVGHTGTLDPEVTGVLPICIGKATRLSDFIMEMPKVYQGQMTLGISTATQDFSGEIIEEQKVKDLTENKIYEVFQTFIGEIQQIPPMYSSIKVKGKKLYELARMGKEIERQPRKVTIYDLKITFIDLDSEYPKIDFNVTCSKGTYVRTLCYDIGQKLGFPAHMSRLTRTKSGPFTIDQSYSLEEIEKFIDINQIQDIIVSMANSLPHYLEIVLIDQDIENKVFNGQIIELDSLKTFGGIVKVLDYEGNLVALYEKQENNSFAKPKRVFKQD